jgi:hypothetical protein
LKNLTETFYIVSFYWKYQEFSQVHWQWS